MNLIFSDSVSLNKTEFLKEVVRIADLLLINPNWLMAVMKKESGINHLAVNISGGATGLIQIMPKTALGLGTTTAELLQMSNVEQLHYVYLYYKPYRGRIKSYVDLYMITFFPVALGKPDDWVIQSSDLSASTIAKYNSVIDLNKDNQITVAEFAQYCYKGFSASIVEILKKKK